MKQKSLQLWASLLLCACVMASCSTKRQVVTPKPSKSIVILYENDVHCGIDGYAKMAGLRDAINRSDTAWAAVVCSGDFLQGGTSGAISRGQYIVDIMRNMGYAAITLGNHEFDYGVPRMKNILDDAKLPVVCANFYDVGAEKPYFPAYVIHQFGDKRIAFVGAVTPETMILEEYAFYDDHDKLTWTLKPETFYPLIQQAVDNARKEGADYVVLLSHVGESTQSMGFDSHRLVAATQGIDVVLDGHSHSVIPHDMVDNLQGKTIAVTQTGTQFANIGKLLIKNGRFTTELLPSESIHETNAQVKATTDSVKAAMEAVVSRVICTSDYELQVLDENNDYIVRAQETNAGDLATDAYRTILGADISLENGGGLRNSVKGGNITYGDVTALSPYDQRLYVVEATGADIVKALQEGTKNTPELDGNFPQCSGLKYTLHTGNHTVTDVMVEDKATATFVPLDMEKKYTVALTAYYRGGGFNNALKNCRVVKMSGTLSRDIIAEYMEKNLGGTLGTTYSQPQGRITILP